MVNAGYPQKEAEEMMKDPRPADPEFFVDTARKATGTKARKTVDAKQLTPDDIDDAISAALLGWQGKRKKKGKYEGAPRWSAFVDSLPFHASIDRCKAVWLEMEGKDE